MQVIGKTLVIATATPGLQSGLTHYPPPPLHGLPNGCRLQSRLREARHYTPHTPIPPLLACGTQQSPSKIIIPLKPSSLPPSRPLPLTARSPPLHRLELIGLQNRLSVCEARPLSPPHPRRVGLPNELIRLQSRLRACEARHHAPHPSPPTPRHPRHVGTSDRKWVGTSGGAAEPV